MPDTVDDDPSADLDPPQPDGDAGGGRRWKRPAAIAAVVALAGLGVGLGLGLSGSGGGSPTPEGVPLQNVPALAAASSTVSGAPVDGITCRKAMDDSVSYHIHVHLDVFVNGVQRRVPAGAGIDPPLVEEAAPGGVFVDNGPSSCLYWLHLHANDGILHVEAPTKQAFTLGQFFDIWNQPLSSSQVGPAKGAVVAFVNGRRYDGNPRDIPLVDLENVQLDVGSPVVAYQPLHFTVTGSCSTNCGPPPQG